MLLQKGEKMDKLVLSLKTLDYEVHTKMGVNFIAHQVQMADIVSNKHPHNFVLVTLPENSKDWFYLNVDCIETFEPIMESN